MRSSSLKPEFLGLVIAYFKPQVTSFFNVNPLPCADFVFLVVSLALNYFCA